LKLEFRSIAKFFKGLGAENPAVGSAPLTYQYRWWGSAISSQSFLHNSKINNEFGAFGLLGVWNNFPVYNTIGKTNMLFVTESFGQNLNYPEEFDGSLDCISLAVTCAYNSK
jgi:hypothetical protein